MVKPEDSRCIPKAQLVCWLTFSPCAVRDSEPYSWHEGRSLMWPTWSPGRTGLGSTSFQRPAARALSQPCVETPGGLRPRSLEWALNSHSRNFQDIFTCVPVHFQVRMFTLSSSSSPKLASLSHSFRLLQQHHLPSRSWAGTPEAALAPVLSSIATLLLRRLHSKASPSPASSPHPGPGQPSSVRRRRHLFAAHTCTSLHAAAARPHANTACAALLASLLKTYRLYAWHMYVCAQ